LKDYDELKKAIPLLSQTEIKDLLNRCRLLLRKEANLDDWLLDGIVYQLRLHGIIVPSFEKIKNLHDYSAFSEKSESLRSLIEEQGISSKIEKRQIAIICTECMIEYLKGFTDVSLQNVMRFIDHLPQALERAFPGYLSSGMLPFIVKSGTLH